MSEEEIEQLWTLAEDWFGDFGVLDRTPGLVATFTLGIAELHNDHCRSNDAMRDLWHKAEDALKAKREEA